MSTNSFFLIGALAEGMSLFKKIQPFVEATESAVYTGSAYRLRLGFPVLSKEGQDAIQGTLAHFRSSEIIVNVMDELMGFNPQDPEQSLNLRETVVVETSHGMKEVFIYFINLKKHSSQLKRIEDGDWQKSLREMPAIPQKLSEKQKNYIQRLGLSSGREIVPIDLSLYRELMNLELVIDKGRRIALTKLGQEVFRYL
ncbi:MAG: gamma-glutamylcyclotransferase [Bdellovibrionaceae bacterium]|nr:gamma-glutamylcyclotransferase [Pseudobdellovibrionaceae bacterium]